MLFKRLLNSRRGVTGYFDIPVIILILTLLSAIMLPSFQYLFDPGLAAKDRANAIEAAKKVISELKPTLNTAAPRLNGTKSVTIQGADYLVNWEICKNKSYCSPNSTYLDLSVTQNTKKIYDVGVLLSARR